MDSMASLESLNGQAGFRRPHGSRVLYWQNTGDISSPGKISNKSNWNDFDMLIVVRLRKEGEGGVFSY